jgi:hypothetical protein
LQSLNGATYLCIMQANDKVLRVEELLVDNLRAKHAAMQAELEEINKVTQAFEAKLRAALSNEIIEDQELTSLYKQQKKEKKGKRQDQKKRGKNYKEPTGLVTRQFVEATPRINSEDTKELKRLYREAMLHVHPDKFSMEEDKIDLATEATTRLIEIYKQADLAAMVVFHAHILAGGVMSMKNAQTSANQKLASVGYWKMELEKLAEELKKAKERKTYRIWRTYDDPYTFIQELKEYYLDRIAKMKRRTRTT